MISCYPSPVGCGTYTCRCRVEVTRLHSWFRRSHALRAQEVLVCRLFRTIATARQPRHRSVAGCKQDRRNQQTGRRYNAAVHVLGNSERGSARPAQAARRPRVVARASDDRATSETVHRAAAILDAAAHATAPTLDVRGGPPVICPGVAGRKEPRSADRQRDGSDPTESEASHGIQNYPSWRAGQSGTRFGQSSFDRRAE